MYTYICIYTCVCIAQDIYFYIKSRAVCASRSIGTSYIYIYIYIKLNMFTYNVYIHTYMLQMITYISMYGPCCG